MALRIRKDGSILCAAMHPEEDGDTYINDELHYKMSVEYGVIVSENMEQHQNSGEWWWVGNIPKYVRISDWRMNIHRKRESNYIFRVHEK